MHQKMKEAYYKKVDELAEAIENISHKMNIELSKTLSLL